MKVGLSEEADGAPVAFAGNLQCPIEVKVGVERTVDNMKVLNDLWNGRAIG
jgi:hypothetical protein